MVAKLLLKVPRRVSRRSIRLNIHVCPWSGVGEEKVRRSRLPSVASGLMILLGLLTINYVNAYAGIVLMVLGIAMYAAYRRLGRSRSRRMDGDHDPKTPRRDASVKQTDFWWATRRSKGSPRANATSEAADLPPPYPPAAAV